METYAGRSVRISLEDGSVYDGYVHSWNAQNGKLSLEKVVYTEDNERKRLHGLQHFFHDEIASIIATEEVIKNKSKPSNEKKVERGLSILKNKCTPPHLNRLNFFDPTAMVLKNWSEKDGLNSSGNEEVSSDPELERVTYPGCTILDKFDQTFVEAVSFIQQNLIVAVSLEGVGVGRSGQLCWLQIATDEHVFMFDVLKLGKSCFEKGLAAILENGDILKVLHDCRMVSDILHHQFNTKLVNVFDTQVASVIVYRMYHHNDWPRYVEGLASCLVHHLGLSPQEINWALVRERNREIDEEVWKMRPIKRHLVDAAVKNVKHLLALRQVLMEKMLGEFVAGVNIYLSHVKDASTSDSIRYQSMSHLLPISFQNLSCFLPRFNDRSWKNPYLSCKQESKDTNGFRENCSGIIQPNVNFSRDSLWHTGSTPQHVNKKLVQSGMHEESNTVPSPQPKSTPSANSTSTKTLTQQEPTGTIRPQIIEPVTPSAHHPNTPVQLIPGDDTSTDTDTVSELRGTSLMRALVNQQTVGLNDQSDIDDLTFMPAGKIVKVDKNSRQRSVPRSSMSSSAATTAGASRGTGYNFIPRNVLSQQEIELGNKLKKSLTTSVSATSIGDQALSPGSTGSSAGQSKHCGSSPFVNGTLPGREIPSHGHMFGQSNSENSENQLPSGTIFKRTQALLQQQGQRSESDSEERGREEKEELCTSPLSGSKTVSPSGKIGRMDRLLQVLNKQNMS